MLKKNKTIIILTLILISLMSTASTCFDFIKPDRGFDALDLVDDLADDNKTFNEDLDADQSDPDDDQGPPPYVPQVPDPFTELYDNMKLGSLDWGLNSLYPAALNDDRAKVVFFQDENGVWIYSIMGEIAGLQETQVDMIGWGHWTMEIPSPWSGPPPDQVFPCDEDISNLPPGQDWFTVCPEGAGVNSGTKWHVVYSVFDSPIITNDPDHSLTFAAVFDADGNPENNFSFMEPYNWDYWQNTDQWYILDWMNIDQSWNVNVMGPNWEPIESNARAVVYDNAVFWIIQADEFAVMDPGVRVTSFATTGGWDSENVGGDVNGADPQEPLTPLDSDPIHVMDPEFTLVSIALDGWDTCAPGKCVYNESIREQQKTFVMCKDSGCSALVPPGTCKLFSRPKGSSPQDPNSWSFVADTNVRMQKDMTLVYHCFCVK